MDAYEDEITRRRAEIGTIEAEIARLATILPKVRERVDSRRKLVAKKYAARMAPVELEEELADTAGRLAVSRRRLTEARTTLASAISQRKQAEAEFRRDTLAQLAEAGQRAASLAQELIKAAKHSRLQTLTAPVDGVVQQLAVHTVGGVVAEAQALMALVPADRRLEIEVMVQNRDIGFVDDGQEAEIKVESFPFTRYGTVAGTVLHVSRDAVQDEQQGLVYPARVAMARTHMRVGRKDVNLGPGMAVTVEIKTGRRKLIDYLLAPLQRYKAESLRER